VWVAVPTNMHIRIPNAEAFNSPRVSVQWFRWNVNAPFRVINEKLTGQKPGATACCPSCHTLTILASLSEGSRGLLRHVRGAAADCFGVGQTASPRNSNRSKGPFHAYLVRSFINHPDASVVGGMALGGGGDGA